MYALFTAVPLVGHLNPLIRQAEELRHRGWRVAIASLHELGPHVAAESPDLPFVDLGPLGEVAADLRRNEDAASRDRHFARGTLRIVRGLGAVWPLMYDGLTAAVAEDRPDIMVVDLFSAAGVCVADAAGIPVVINNPDLLPSLPVTLLPPADEVPFLFSGRSIRNIGWGQRLAGPLVRRLAGAVASLTVGRDLNAMRATRGLSPVSLDAFLRERLIMVNGAFGVEYERPLPPTVHLVGPMLPSEVAPLPDELSRWLHGGTPVVYVNLGTLAVASDVQLAVIVEALTSDRFRALWIVRPASRLPRTLPRSVRVLEWGPLPFAILTHPNVRAFVSHCGINSAYESLAAGAPIVGIPMFADQRDMAVRVADAGAGVWLDKHRFHATDLRHAIERVLDDPSFTHSLPAVQAAIARSGGVKRAADLIELEAARPSESALSRRIAAGSVCRAGLDGPPRGP